jgi:dynein light chain Tctex-type 1
MQKADCGLNISGSCYWDNDIDGTVTVKWDNQSLTCIVNVFGCGLWSIFEIYDLLIIFFFQ